MDLRDMFTTWHRSPGEAFRLSQPLSKIGCPCNRVPHAMWKLRMRIIERMEDEGHRLRFNPVYEITQDGVGIRCQRCGDEVRGLISQITADYVMVDFVTPEVPPCTGREPEVTG